MNKQKIRNNFNHAVESYDQVAFVQKDCANILASTFHKVYNNFQPNSILDLGTGTGYIPEILLKTFPEAHYTLNDISPNMIKFNQTKFNANKKINYCLGDMETTEFPFYDLIISNFAIQWLNNFEGTIKKLYNKTNILAFSCLLDGTFKEWHSILTDYAINPPFYKYPTRRELEKFIISLKPNNYKFKRKVIKVEFPNITSFLHYLKNLGANTDKKNIPFLELKKIIQNYRGTFSITYDVFFVFLENH